MPKPPANHVKDVIVMIPIPNRNFSVCRSISDRAPLHVAQTKSICKINIYGIGSEVITKLDVPLRGVYGCGTYIPNVNES